eukprot:GILI01003713.1.p1 GENE.GILI01003713.1~~GILI01003713.1.p1  ORF type:complete len:275 (+),score=90.58 GILI01003713.1:78-827(+)
MSSSSAVAPVKMTPKQKVVFVNQLCKFFNQYEGRDKLSKVFQYGSRFLAYALLTKNPDLAKRFAALFVGMRDARKLFRLFKSVNEYQKLSQVLGQKTDGVNKALAVINRLAFLSYWIWDNLGMLSTIKFLRYQPAPLNKMASLSWLIGLVTQILMDLLALAENLERESRLTSQSSTKSAEELHEELKKLRAKRSDLYLSLVKCLGDCITASNGVELPKMLVGRQFSDGAVGLGGLTSAVLTCYQLWPSE